MRTRLLIPAALFASAAMLPAQDRWRPEAVEVRPFAGVYVPLAAQRADFESATLLGALVAFRFEARDYLSCFESPVTGVKRTRNDSGLSVGLADHIQ